jgi:REP element-mobilizing transposase RayT
MPRGPRLDAPGVIHHLTIRGVGGRDIFIDDQDREDLLTRLARLAPELFFAILAWALMSNHVHLVIRSGPVRISHLMSRLMTGYAQYFNKRHGWVGHVTQNRFHSSRVGDDAYLLAAIAYVHRNPVEAGLVRLEALADYPWCGHGALIGATPPRPFEAAAEALALFGSPARAWDAVARAESVAEPCQWRRSPMPAPPRPRSGTGFDALLADSALVAGVTSEAILSPSRSRDVTRARAVVATHAVRDLGLTITEVASRLHVSQPAVSQMVRQRGRKERTT